MEVAILKAATDVSWCFMCGRSAPGGTAQMSIDGRCPVNYCAKCADGTVSLAAVSKIKAARVQRLRRLIAKADQWARKDLERLQAQIDRLVPQFKGQRTRQFEALGGVEQALAKARAARRVET